MISRRSAHLTTSGKSVFGLEHQPLTPTITESEAQLPKLFREHVLIVFFRIPVARNGKSVLRENLTPARRRVEPSMNFLRGLNIIMEHPPPVVGRGIIVVVLQHSPGGLESRPRKPRDRTKPGPSQSSEVSSPSTSSLPV